MTKSRKIWENDEVGRIIASPVIHEGLLYVADYRGFAHCLDAKTGKNVWSHDLFAGVWGSVLIADEKIYIGDEDGTMTVMKLGRKPEVLATNDMGAAIWSTSSVAGNVLYVTTSHEIYAIAKLD